MADLWYIETASPLGNWCPAIIHGAEPVIEGSGEGRRLKLLHSTGPRVQSGTPVQIAAGYEQLTLDQLRQIYSPNGKFRSCRHGR